MSNPLGKDAANSHIVSQVETSLKRKRVPDAVLVCTIFIFFLGLLPITGTFVVYLPHPERNYTDAAISMLQTSDFLTPRKADGSVRLSKPPLIYWHLIGSYKLLGVSSFSSRIVFLLAGCAIILLSYALALRLTGNEDAARLTAFILLSHPLLIIASFRSMPDVLLAFWMLVSGYGFIRLICLDDDHPFSYWAAYGGATVAIATKGLLPLVFLAYAFVFAQVTSSGRKPFRRILNFKVILICIFATCLWLFPMIWKHGYSFFQDFWGDQVGKKFALQGSAIVRIGGYFLIYVLNFLPWFLCLSFLFYKQKSKTSLETSQGKACVFIALWALILPVIFGFGDILNSRYLLPATPLLAVAIAIGLCRFPSSAVARAVDPLLSILTGVFAIAAILALIALWQTNLLTRHLAGPVILLLMVAFAAARLLTRHLSSPGSFSVSSFLFLPLIVTVASPFTWPDHSAQIARQLRTLNTAKAPVFVIGPLSVASRVKISTGAMYPVYQVDSFDSLKEAAAPNANTSILVLPQSDAQRLSPGSFQIHEIASALGGISFPDMLRAFLHGELKSYFDSRKEVYCAAIPVSIR